MDRRAGEGALGGLTRPPHTVVGQVSAVSVPLASRGAPPPLHSLSLHLLPHLHGRPEDTPVPGQRQRWAALLQRPPDAHPTDGLGPRVHSPGTTPSARGDLLSMPGLLVGQRPKHGQVLVRSPAWVHAGLHFDPLLGRRRLRLKLRSLTNASPPVSLPKIKYARKPCACTATPLPHPQGPQQVLPPFPVSVNVRCLVHRDEHNDLEDEVSLHPQVLGPRLPLMLTGTAHGLLVMGPAA